MTTWIRRPGQEAPLPLPAEEAPSVHRYPRHSYRRAKDLVWAVSRDLRAPLSSIQTLVESLSQYQSTVPSAETPVPEVLNRVSRLSKQAIDTIDDLLSVERLEDETRADAPPAHRVDVEEIINEAIIQQRDALDMAGCQVLVSRGDRTDPLHGAWDRELLVRVFGNLLGSATRYAPGALVRIQLTEFRRWLRVEMTEGGPGLAPGNAEGALDGSQFTVEARDGRYGLELWVATHVISALGGEMHVQRSPDSGVNFDIRLPRGPLND